jgi:hypothetical protein
MPEEGVLHGLKSRGIDADQIREGLDRARTIDPVTGVGGIFVMQTDHGTSVGFNTPFGIQPVTPGIIDNTGPLGTEADLSAPQYWAKIGYIPGDDFNNAVTINPSEFGQFFYVRLTNIAEQAGGDRLLSKDDQVAIFISTDLDGQFRFWTASRGGGGGAYFKVTAGGGVCRKLVKDDPSHTTTGGDVNVKFIQGHQIGDFLYAVKMDNGTDVVGTTWVEILTLPQPKSQYQLVQVVDGTGRLGIDSARYE